MSFTTGTQTECLGANSAVGTALASSSAVALITPPSAAGFLPANFFLPSYGPAKSIRVKAAGVLGTTGTPNLTIEVLANSTLASRNSSGILATTAATAQASSVTNVPWDLECTISCVTTGTTATLLSFGMFRVYTATTAVQGIRLSSSTANPNTAYSLTGGSVGAYYVELSGLWSAASASNTIQVYTYTVEGLN